MSSKKILIVVTNHSELGKTGKKTGWYLPEVAHPYHIFQNNGYTVEFLSPKGGYAPVDQASVANYSKDEICNSFWGDESIKKALQNTKSPSQVNFKDYAAIYFAGGHGPMFDFPTSEEVAKLAQNIYENGGVVGAVCHGPVGLVNVKLSNGEYLLKGKTVTGFTNAEEEEMKTVEAMPFLLEDKLKERGATFKGADKWAANVVVSDRLVTGQNPASAAPSAEAVVNLLKK